MAGAPPNNGHPRTDTRNRWLRLTSLLFAMQLLLLAGAGWINELRQQHDLRVLQQTHLQALGSAYALSFSRVLILDDKDAAADLVMLFESDPDIAQIYLYDRQGKPVFRYQADEILPPPQSPGGQTPRASNGGGEQGRYLPLAMAGQAFGTAYLRLSHHADSPEPSPLWLSLITLVPVALLLAGLIGWLGTRLFDEASS